MIDIFLIAASIENAQCIVARLEDSGVRYRLRTAYGSVRQLHTHARVIRDADLLIVDDANLNTRGLDSVEETLAAVRSALSQTGISKHVFVVDQGSRPEHGRLLASKRQLDQRPRPIDVRRVARPRAPVDRRRGRYDRDP